MITQLSNLAAKVGSHLPPLEFYHHVQLAFHDVESESYDELHEDMYIYLADIFTRLFSPLVHGRKDLIILDIGAGTGLVETFIARQYSHLVQRIDIIEPNARMIRKLQEKNRNWNLPVCYMNSYLEDAAIVDQYDVVVCSSVLHHIPDLKSFFSVLCQHVKPGGLILTMQDPRNEACSDAIAANRRVLCQEYEDAHRAPDKHTVKRLVRMACKMVGMDNVVFRKNPVEIAVNKTLRRNKVIKKHLSMAEIWAITDIHVPDQPGGMGEGISLKQLQGWLSDFVTVEYITYNFFNQNYLNLPESFKEMEKQFLANSDTHGFLFASLFKRQK